MDHKIMEYRNRLGEAMMCENDAVAENERLRAWVADLQSGMYVNCVYCGHRYGPGETTPVSMADALKAHVAACPKHPMAQLRAKHDALLEAIRRIRTHLERYCNEANAGRTPSNAREFMRRVCGLDSLLEEFAAEINK